MQRKRHYDDQKDEFEYSEEKLRDNKNAERHSSWIAVAFNHGTQGDGHMQRMSDQKQGERQEKQVDNGLKRGQNQNLKQGALRMLTDVKAEIW